MSGLRARFFSERHQRNGTLGADEWFDPYLDDFVLMAQAAGVTLCNDLPDDYGVRADVVTDINQILSHEKQRFPDHRRKSYEQVAHDVILWHWVREQRPAFVESPIEAEDWILTVDYRLIGFDAYQLKQYNASVPLCLHPTSLVHLLEFWVPRTQKFEEALLGGLRLPFLFQDFDPNAERLSLKIISRLGRFQGSQHIPHETILNVVMNDSLRSRIDEGGAEDEELQLVRDTYIDELQSVTAAQQAETEELRAIIQSGDLSLERSQDELNAKNTEIEQLRRRIEEDDEKRGRRALLGYFAAVLLLFALSMLVSRWTSGLVASFDLGSGASAVSGLAGTCGFLFGHLLLEAIVNRKQQLAHLYSFQQITRFRKWLWRIVFSLVVGVGGNLLARSF